MIDINILKENECPICYEEIKEKIITECKHTFCKSCITKSLVVNNRCPLCQQNIKNVEKIIIIPKHIQFFINHYKLFLIDIYHLIFSITSFVCVYLFETSGMISHCVVFYGGYSLIVVLSYSCYVIGEIMTMDNFTTIEHYKKWVSFIRKINMCDVTVSIVFIIVLSDQQSKLKLLLSLIVGINGLLFIPNAILYFKQCSSQN